MEQGRNWLLRYKKGGRKYTVTHRVHTQIAVCVWAQGVSSQVGSWNAEEAMSTRIGMEGNGRTGRPRWLIGLQLVCS